MTIATTTLMHEPPRWERFVAGALLFIFVCGMPLSWVATDPTATTADTATEERAFVRLLWMPVYLVSGLLAAAHFKTMWGMMSRNVLLLMLIGLTVLSVGWSLYPADTLRRCVGLASTTLFALYLADQFRVVSLLRMLSMTLVLAMVLSLATVLMVPDVGTMRYDDVAAWRGIFSHKNSLGLTMLLAVVVFVGLSRLHQETRWFYWTATGAALGLLYLSHSFTPVMVGMIVLPFYALLELNRRPSVYARAAAALTALCVALAVLFLVLNLEGFFASAGKDFTLTGRTLIWSLVWGFIKDRLWLGYGYQAFWLKGPHSPAGSVWQHIEWEFQEAHNGFLEVWLGIGVVGLGLFLAWFVRVLWWALQHYRLNRAPDSSWPLTFVVLFLLINVTESHILIQNDGIWVLYVCTALSLWKWKQSLVHVRRTAVWRTPSPEFGPMAS